MTFPNRRLVLLAATLLAGIGTVAVAQSNADNSVYDPAQLPALHGKVAQYDLTPRGDVDGLILQDGTEVHFAPHLGTQVVAILRPGDAVTIHGLKARSLPLVEAMSVTADAANKTVVSAGPAMGGHRAGGGGGGHHPWPISGQKLQAQGQVKMQLHGPRGETNGVLLTDGTILHMPPPEATRLADQIKAGATIVANGEGSETVLGRVLEAQEIGPSADKLAPLQHPPGHGWGHDAPHGSVTGEDAAPK